MSISVVAVVWAVLSLLVAVAFWLSLLQPHWFIHDETMTSLGVYSYCYQDDDDVVVTTLAPPGGGDEQTPVELTVRQNCRVYGDGRPFHFSHLPSVYWQASCVLLGSASVLQSASALLAVFVICLSRRCDNTVAAVTGYIQIVAGRSLLPYSPYRAVLCPAPRAGELSDDVRLTSICLTSGVCLSRTSGLSREQRSLGRLKLAQR